MQKSQKRRAWGYCRCSHQRQIDEGDTLDVQRTMIEAICTLEGYELAGIFAEPGISGSVPFAEREQGAALMATVRKGDVIVCLKLDRAFRDSLDALGTLEALQRRGVGLYLRDMNGDVTENSVASWSSACSPRQHPSSELGLESASRTPRSTSATKGVSWAAGTCRSALPRKIGMARVTSSPSSLCTPKPEH